MLRTLAKGLITVVGLTTGIVTANGQTIKGNIMEILTKTDLSGLWVSDSLPLLDGKKMARTEPLSFYGAKYERQYIHFNYIAANADNPKQYIVAGKTKRGEQVYNFRGTLTVRRAEYMTETVDKTYRRATIFSDIAIIEDASKPGAGMINGTMSTYVLVDGDEGVQYDVSNLASEQYRNNQFAGSWRSYKPGQTVACNWGDYRIPNSGKLDVGTTNFMVADEYKANGWQGYMQYRTGGAGFSETEQWWK